MANFIGQYFPHLVICGFSLFAMVLGAVSLNDNLRGPVS